LLTTLMVTMPFLARTTTPSMALSSAEVTLPVTDAGELDWAFAWPMSGRRRQPQLKLESRSASVSSSLRANLSRHMWPRGSRMVAARWLAA